MAPTSLGPMGYLKSFSTPHESRNKQPYILLFIVDCPTLLELQPPRVNTRVVKELINSLHNPSKKQTTNVVHKLPASKTTQVSIVSIEQRKLAQRFIKKYILDNHAKP